MNIALSLDGVLRGPTGDLVHKGLLVYRAFKSVGRVVLLTGLERAQAEGWLLINNINDYDDLIDASVALDPEEGIRHRQLLVCQAKGPVSVYVEADPDWASTGLRLGITTLLFAESEYSHYLFRPDAPKTVRPWDEIVAERTRQQVLAATDQRLKPMDMGTWE